MGAKATFDPLTRIIKLTEAPTLVDGELRVSLDVKIDLYGDQKEDWLSNLALRKLRPPITVIGGQTTPIGFAGNTFFLANDWNVELYDSDQILTVDGNFFKQDGTSPFIKPSVGTYSTQIDRFVSNIVDTLATGSGVLPSDVTAIANQVWANTLEGTYTAEEIMRIMSAVLAGKSSKTGGVRTFRDMNDTKDRAVASVTDAGDRTAVVLDGT